MRIVGEENRDNLSTMEGAAGGEEIGDSFSVPSRLKTAAEIQRVRKEAKRRGEPPPVFDR